MSVLKLDSTSMSACLGKQELDNPGVLYSMALFISDYDKLNNCYWTPFQNNDGRDVVNIILECMVKYPSHALVHNSIMTTPII